MKLFTNIATVTTATFVILNLSNTNSLAASVHSFPVPAEDIPSWVDPELIAFAGYDYAVTEGGLGQYTTLIKGSESLFDETLSGLSSLVGDWSYIP